VPAPSNGLITGGTSATGASASTLPRGVREGERLQQYTPRMPSFSSWGTAVANMAANGQAPPAAHGGHSSVPFSGPASTAQPIQLQQPRLYTVSTHNSGVPSDREGVTRTVTITSGLGPGPGASGAPAGSGTLVTGDPGALLHPAQRQRVGQADLQQLGNPMPSQGDQQWLQKGAPGGAAAAAGGGAQRTGIPQISDHMNGVQQLRSQLLAKLGSL
jgi:hypothetical protein